MNLTFLLPGPVLSTNTHRLSHCILGLISKYSILFPNFITLSPKMPQVFYSYLYSTSTTMKSFVSLKHSPLKMLNKFDYFHSYFHLSTNLEGYKRLLPCLLFMMSPLILHLLFILQYFLQSKCSIIF